LYQSEIVLIIANGHVVSTRRAILYFGLSFVSSCNISLSVLSLQRITNHRVNTFSLQCFISSVSKDKISSLKLSKRALSFSEYHSWVSKHHPPGISYHINQNSFASFICLCLHLQLMSNNFDLSTSHDFSYSVSFKSFAESGLRISFHDTLFTAFSHLVVWLIGLCPTTSHDAIISNHSFSAISKAVFIINQWQSIHGFIFFQYQYFGFFTTSRCGSEIFTVLILIQFFCARVSAFSFQKNGVQNVIAVQSIHCDSSTFIANMLSSHPENKISAFVMYTYF
jgi:hypothetical protein